MAIWDFTESVFYVYQETEANKREYFRIPTVCRGTGLTRPLTAQRAVNTGYASAVSTIAVWTGDKRPLITNRPIIYGYAVQCQQTLDFPVW